MEPIFGQGLSGDPELSKLVPQIAIDIGNGRQVSVLDAGHRLGDALVRSSTLKDAARQASRASRDGRRHRDRQARADLARVRRVGLA